MAHEAYEFSWPLLAMLITILVASSLVFWKLVQRSTIHWRSVELADWAKLHGFSIQTRIAKLPSPLTSVQAGGTLAEIILRNKRENVVRFQTAAGTSGARQWHVLVRPIETDWPATGLRPMGRETSVLDLFALEEFPHLPHGARFGVIGTQSQAARKLSSSSARALLPGDIGLLLHGRHLVVDFSSRPFDEIEVGRMIALADQLMTHLPPLNA